MLVGENTDGAPLRGSVFFSQSGPVAQLGARFHGMEEVAGSIPARSTNSLNKLDGAGACNHDVCVMVCVITCRFGACGKNFCFDSIRRLHRFNIRRLTCRVIATIVESEGTALRRLRDGATPEARGSSEGSLLAAILANCWPTEHEQSTEHSGDFV